MLKKIKDFFTLVGTKKRINQLIEIKQYLLISILIVGFLFSIAVPLLLLKQSGLIGTDITSKYDRNIAVLHLNEQITVPYINRIMEKLNQLKIKAKEGEFSHLLIVASSPGGSPQGSDELATYLLEYQKEIPTTFYVQNVCASGCYYIAAAMKYDENNSLSGIIANVNSVIGSIGVVLPHFVYGPALERLGMQNEYIVEGKHKVPIDSWSLASEESKAYIKSNLLAPVYKTFQDFVQTHRGLSDSQMNELNGGRIFVSSLVEGTLVDRLSNYHKIRAEIKAKVQKQYPDDEIGFVVIDTKEQKPTLFSSMFSIENLSIDSNILKTTSKITDYTQMH